MLWNGMVVSGRQEAGSVRSIIFILLVNWSETAELERSQVWKSGFLQAILILPEPSVWKLLGLHQKIWITIFGSDRRPLFPIVRPGFIRIGDGTWILEEGSSWIGSAIMWTLPIGVSVLMKRVRSKSKDGVIFRKQGFITALHGFFFVRNMQMVRP